MKKQLFVLVLFALFAELLFAQAPQAFNYQAIARDGSGILLSDQDLGIRINLLQGGVDGPVVYSETHQVKSNHYGMINVIIGEGQVETGEFSSLNWGASSLYIMVEMDSRGGKNYEEMGTAALYSVPYALYAVKAGDIVRKPAILNEKQIKPSPVGGEIRSNGTYNCKISSDGDSYFNTLIGKVGIGITDPFRELHVKNSISGGGILVEGVSSPTIYLKNTGGGINEWAMFVEDGSGKLKLSHGVSQLISITPTGSLGVGSLNPASKLDVSGAIPTGTDNLVHFTSNDDGLNDVRTVLALRRNSYNTIEGGFGASLDVYLEDAIGGSFQWFTDDGTVSNVNLRINQRFEHGMYTRVVIKANGNVGINNQNPQRKLHVSHVLRLEPRTQPLNPADGDIYVDFGTKKLRCYGDGAWHDLW